MGKRAMNALRCGLALTLSSGCTAESPPTPPPSPPRLPNGCSVLELQHTGHYNVYVSGDQVGEAVAPGQQAVAKLEAARQVKRIVNGRVARAVVEIALFATSQSMPTAQDVAPNIIAQANSALISALGDMAVTSNWYDIHGQAYGTNVPTGIALPSAADQAAMVITVYRNTGCTNR
jgi:hypothetical protein